MVVVIMGPSGAGKTTVGRELAATLGWPFRDADDFHSPANVERMAAGVPLEDRDREPWLAALAQLISAALQAGTPLVLACSALKRAYRERLAADLTAGGPWFVHLQAPADVLAERLSRRRGHYFAPSLLASQLATLEPPAPGESARAFVVDAAPSPSEIVAAIRARLGV